MFKAKQRQAETFDEVMYKAILSTVRDALESILRMEYSQAAGADGEDEIDYEMTARMMKAQARIALDLVANIKQSEVSGGNDHQNEKREKGGTA